MTEAKWAEGPDTFDFEAHGLSCAMRRHPRLGHWCGYVGVGKDHPMYRKDYDDCEVEVHGGLTWANDAPGGDKDAATDKWWFGFDCAHVGDFVPGGGMAMSGDVYRDADYVRAECDSLASQLAKSRGDK